MTAKNISRTSTPASTKVFVSLLTPAYNEASVLESSVEKIYAYMTQLESQYDWELVIVNDGSKDDTAQIAEKLAAEKDNLVVVHHRINRNLGQALQTGFRHCTGDYIVVLDIDLSYSPDHIEALMAEAIETDADIVVASPYMKGGRSTEVPKMRLLLSRTVNMLMRWVSPIKLHTFTGMVRAYKTEFLQGLSIKSSTYSINPEIINKAFIMRGRIREIPAHLDWSYQEKAVGRTSSIKIIAGILAGFMESFIFRPYMFFMTIGAILMVISLYIITWIFINTFLIYPEVMESAQGIEDTFSEAVGLVFKQRPYSFFVGGITLIIALQFLSLGFLSLQKKRYFDELFHLGTSIFRKVNQKK